MSDEENMDLSKKTIRVDIGEDAWFTVRNLTWREVEDINIEARDPETGKEMPVKRAVLILQSSIEDFGGLTIGGEETTYPDDLEKVIDLLHQTHAIKISTAATVEYKRALELLGNSEKPSDSSSTAEGANGDSDS